MQTNIPELLKESDRLKREMQDRAQRLVGIYAQLHSSANTLDVEQRHAVRLVGNVNVRIAKALTNAVARLDEAERRIKALRDPEAVKLRPRGHTWESAPPDTTAAKPPKKSPTAYTAPTADPTDWEALYGADSPDELLFLELAAPAEQSPATAPAATEDPEDE